MTALSTIQDLLSRELGTTGWVLIQEPNGAARLRTQRGEIPFSTLKLLVEAVPDVVTEKSSYDKGYTDGFSEARWS